MSAVIHVVYYTGPHVGPHAGPGESLPFPGADALVTRLPAARRERLERLANAQQRALDLASLRLLEIGMHQAGFNAFRLADVAYPLVGNLSAKPHWTARAAEFSIAHTRGLAACAVVTGCRVGIDAEVSARIDPRLVVRLLRSDASPLRDLNEANAAAYWTTIEAVLKGAGIGVMHGREIEWQGRAIVLRGRRWWIHRVECGEKHVAHVAVDVPNAQLIVERVERLD